jgi:hypothetical protein
MGRALAQVEHVLRGSRVSLWGWPAVQAMDALVQVYTELAKQVCCIYWGLLLSVTSTEHIKAVVPA